MKKSTKAILAVLSAACMAAFSFAFTACGSDDDATESNKDNTTQTQTTDGTNTNTSGTNTTDDNDNNSSNNTNESNDNNNNNTNSLTESTDFSSLVGEQVDEDGWKAAFNLLYTNYTSVVTPLNRSENTSTTIKMDGYEYLCSQGEYSSYYTFENDTEILMWNGSYMEYACTEDDFREGTETPYSWGNPDFSDDFSSFEYSAEKGGYVLRSDVAYVETNSIFEAWNNNFCDITVKIVGGRLAYIKCDYGSVDSGTEEFQANNDYYEITFYDYGTTEITRPAIDYDVTEMEWTSAFEVDGFKATGGIVGQYGYNNGKFEECAYIVNVDGNYYVELNASEASYYILEQTGGSWSQTTSDETTYTTAYNKLCAFSVFSDKYSSFNFNSETNAYVCTSLEINDKTYTSISIQFMGAKLVSITYTVGETNYTFSDFGSTEIDLPSVSSGTDGDGE